MRYFIFTILLVVPLLLTAQSKKEQIATLNLRVDSLFEVLLNNAQKLSDKRGEIFQLSQEKSDLEKSIVQISQEKSDLETEVVRLVHDKSKIEEENGRLTLEVDSLAKLILTSPHQINNFGDGMMGTYFNFHGSEFNDNNTNPVLVIPVGWSEDGRFCYITDVCDGTCGCCRLTITIYDVKSNSNIKVQSFNLETEDEDGFGAQIEDEDDWLQIMYSASIQLNDLCKEFNIIPTGLGEFNTPFQTNNYSIIQHHNSRHQSFKIDVIKEDSSWSIVHGGVLDGWPWPESVLLSGDFDIVEYYEAKSPLDIQVSGVIRNPIGEGDHLVAVVLINNLGFEGETDWSMTLVSLPE